MNTEPPTCKECAFWLKAGDKYDTKYGGKGRCHRHYPKGYKEQRVNSFGSTYLETRGRWPVTYGDEWCGEWEEAPKEEKS